MNEIQAFNNDNFGQFHVFLNEDDEPCFVAREVTDALALDRTAVRKLDEDEKGVRLMHTPGGDQEVTTVTEPGFYKLVMRSRKPEAKAFQRWVTHEVLPELRRRGSYQVPMTREERVARALIDCNEIVLEQRETIAKLEAENHALSNKAQAFDLWVDDADGLLSVTKAGKLLKSQDKTMSAKRLRACLRADGYVEKNTLSCTVRAIEPGYMRERLCKFAGKDGRERVKSYGALTAKGVAMCAERYCNQTSLAVE